MIFLMCFVFTKRVGSVKGPKPLWMLSSDDDKYECQWNCHSSFSNQLAVMRRLIRNDLWEWIPGRRNSLDANLRMQPAFYHCGFQLQPEMKGADFSVNLQLRSPQDRRFWCRSCTRLPAEKGYSQAVLLMMQWKGTQHPWGRTGFFRKKI